MTKIDVFLLAIIVLLIIGIVMLKGVSASADNIDSYLNDSSIQIIYE